MKTSLVDFHLVERESVEVSVQGAASGCGQVGAMKNIYVLKSFIKKYTTNLKLQNEYHTYSQKTLIYKLMSTAHSHQLAIFRQTKKVAR